MNNKIIRMLSWYAAFAASVIYATVMPRMMQDSDTAWHLATGRLINDLGDLPKTDPWSFGANGMDWFNLSWLFDVLIAYADEFFGVYALAIFTILAGATAIAVSMKSSMVAGKDVLTSIIVVGFASVLLLGAVQPRPQLISYVMLAVTMLTVENIRRGGGLTLAMLLIIAELLWANCHGGFVLGLGIVGIALFDALIARKFDVAKILAISLLGMLAVVHINPLGFGIWHAVWRTMDSQLIGRVSEWLILNPLTDWYTTINMVAVAFICFRQRKSLALYDWLMLLAGFALAISAIRNVPVMALMIIPAASRALANEVKAHALASERSAVYAGYLEANSGKLPYLIMLTALVAISAYIPATRNIIWNDVDEPFTGKLFPLKAMKYLSDNFAGEDVLNHYDFGGAFTLYPQEGVKHFIDGRADTAFPWHVVRDYLDFTDMKEDWENNLRLRHIRVMLLPADDPVVKKVLNLPGWGWVYGDDKAVILSKVTLRPRQENQ